MTSPKTTNKVKIELEKQRLKTELALQEAALLTQLEALPGVLLNSGFEAGKTAFKAHPFATVAGIVSTVALPAAMGWKSYIWSALKEQGVMLATKVLSNAYAKARKKWAKD